MKPLISFYKNEKYIFSKDYQLVCCKINENLFDFLNDIEKKYANQLKILQINFDAAQTEQVFYEKTLYPCPKASVWILNSFEFLSIDIILNQIKIENQVPYEMIFRPLISQNEFKMAIEKIKFDIRAGRIYQANLTSAFKADCGAEAAIIFADFYQKFNSRYCALLPHQGIDVMSFSPELFLEKLDGVIKTEPIKGSIRPEENIENDLIQNEKENAELSMIVDLLRNDLNRIAYETTENASAEVTQHRSVMKLNYIQHTYSQICIKTNAHLPLVLKCTFPGGSISGCPKNESLKVITENEKYPRGVYTGSIGWWHNNEFSMNLAIRTLIKHENQIYYHAGCGIVFDSDPEKEWKEFLTKAGALQVHLNDYGSDSVLDTFSVLNSEITYLNHRIDRSYEACKLINPQIVRSDIEKIYADVLNQINTTPDEYKKLIFRLHINPNNLNAFTLEPRELTDMPSTLILQTVTRVKSNFSSSGDELLKSHFKWSDRRYWVHLLNQLNSQAHDVLLVDENGFLIETSRFNIFIYDPKEDVVWTPPLSLGCLNGVYRRQVLQLMKIKLPEGTKQVKEKSVQLSELNRMKIYCGNSIRGLLKAELLN